MRRMTFDEMQAKYPDQYIYCIDNLTINGIESGFLISHHKNKAIAKKGISHCIEHRTTCLIYPEPKIGYKPNWKYKYDKSKNPSNQ